MKTPYRGYDIRVTINVFGLAVARIYDACAYPKQEIECLLIGDAVQASKNWIDRQPDAGPPPEPVQ